MSREDWDDLKRTFDPRAEPVMRRANLLVSGVRLAETRGRILRIGGAGIRVHGETRPCHIMDKTLPGLRTALGTAWRGGVFGEVVEGGDIGVGDPVDWVEGAD